MLLGAPGLTTRSKDATFGAPHALVGLVALEGKISTVGDVADRYAPGSTACRFVTGSRKAVGFPDCIEKG